MHTKQFRHGDVLLERIDSKSTSNKYRNALENGKMKVVENKLLVVGEGRDHAHFLNGDTIVAFFDNSTMSESGEVLGVAFVNGAGKLQHLNMNSNTWTKEHKDIEIPVGDYHIIKQRIFDYAERLPKPVQD
jgi:hypothetical protein